MTEHPTSPRPRAGRLRTVVVLALTATTVLGAASCSARPAPEVVPAVTRLADAAPTVTGPTGARVGVDPMARSAPVRLQIPAIGVDTALIDLAVAPDGALQVPPDGTRAGWFTGAPTPGERGPAIMTGHVDWNGHEGVFYDLRHLTRGARISVGRQDGSTAVFRVALVQQVPKGTFPTDEVYGDVDHAALRLITCGGSFDHTAHSYRDNIVVFADLLSQPPGAVALGEPVHAVPRGVQRRASS